MSEQLSFPRRRLPHELAWGEIGGWTTDPLPKYVVGVEDPAWPERGGGKVKRGADQHYALMSVADIISLPIADVMAADAHYWLWATDNYLHDAMHVLEARGFRYVRTYPWVKWANDRLQTGLGQYGRGAHEHLLLGTKGASAVPPPHLRPPSVIMAPRTQHSAKPEAAWQVIEQVSSGRIGPRVEFNCRTPRPGWTGVGHDLGVTIEDFCAPYRG